MNNYQSPDPQAVEAVKIKEIRQRLNLSNHVLVNWFDSDVRLLLSAVDSSQSRIAALEQELIEASRLMRQAFPPRRRSAHHTKKEDGNHHEYY